MPSTPLPITNGFYMSDSLPIAAQECTNWYVNIVQAPALNQETLFGTPGLVELATTGEVQQQNRGSHNFKDRAYVVNGNALYRLNQVVVGDIDTFNVENLGTIGGTGRVWMDDNGTQLMILVPGGDGYIFNDDPDFLQAITDPDFRANGNPQAMVYIDGYFAITTDTKKFIVSALNNGLAYNALDFGTAEADPDDIVAPFVFNNQLFIGGSVTIEAFQNIGGSDFPFLRTGLYINKGITAAFAMTESSESFMWIGGGKKESPAIWQLQGNKPVKVSTTAVDSLIQGFTDIEIANAFAYSYATKGAYFVCFVLPTTTICIDIMTGRWHERKSQIVDALNVTRTVRNRVNSVVTAYGRLVVGDSIDGRIGDMSNSHLYEYDGPIIRRVATQPFQNNMTSFTVPVMELTMEAGVGTTEVPDPKIVMDRSLDGKTWKNERERRIGKKGEYKRRTIWRRNGRAARFEIFRFTLSDAVKPVIIQLTGEIEA